MEIVVFYLCAFILGAILGSFLNVVSLDMDDFYYKHELEDKAEFPIVCKTLCSKSFWSNFFARRSHCDSCGRQLTALDLVPFFSYFLLGGKCRTCEVKITPRHLWAELAAGLMFMEVFGQIFQHHSAMTTAYLVETGFYFVLFSLLFLIVMFDLRRQIIPNMLVYPVIVMAAFAAVFDFQALSFVWAWDYLVAGLAFAAVFASLWFVSGGRWLGLADAKLAMAIGFILGPAMGMSALAVGFWTGALVGLGMIAWGKMRGDGQVGMSTAIAFGPFLVFGMFLIFVTGLNFFPLVLG